MEYSTKIQHFFRAQGFIIQRFMLCILAMPNVAKGVAGKHELVCPHYPQIKNSEKKILSNAKSEGREREETKPEYFNST